jgi:hypothetical protein
LPVAFQPGLHIPIATANPGLVFGYAFQRTLPLPPAVGDDLELRRDGGQVEHVQVYHFWPGDRPPILQPPQALPGDILASQHGDIHVAG